MPRVHARFKGSHWVIPEPSPAHKCPITLYKVYILSSKETDLNYVVDYWLWPSNNCDCSGTICIIRIRQITKTYEAGQVAIYAIVRLKLVATIGWLIMTGWYDAVSVNVAVVMALLCQQACSQDLSNSRGRRAASPECLGGFPRSKHAHFKMFGEQLLDNSSFHLQGWFRRLFYFFCWQRANQGQKTHWNRF